MIAPTSSTTARPSSIARVERGTRDAERADDADRERDVGGHRDAPAARRAAPGDRQVDRGRHGHPADRRGDGEHRRPAGGQVAGGHLPADLQADEDEEERHQPVVHPVAQVEVDPVPGDGDRRTARPQPFVRLLPRRVGPDQCDDRADRDEHGAGRLGRQEVAQRGQCPWPVLLVLRLRRRPSDGRSYGTASTAGTGRRHGRACDRRRRRRRPAVLGAGGRSLAPPRRRRAARRRRRSASGCADGSRCRSTAPRRDHRRAGHRRTTTRHRCVDPRHRPRRARADRSRRPSPPGRRALPHACCGRAAGHNPHDDQESASVRR